MAVFNFSNQKIDAKIVYYGPAISGKTTNLQFIYDHLKPEQRGKMVSLATNEDRTLFFDFLPIHLENLRGFKTRFHLYTVPGQVYYGATRRAVLTGMDGVIFVADSHASRMKDNLASLKDLEDNLKYYGKKIETIPLIIQYNKRDLPGILSIHDLNQEINRMNSPHFESVAVQGKGVFETLRAGCRLILKTIENGIKPHRPASSPLKASPPSPSNSLMVEKAPVQPESAPHPAEATSGRNMLLDRERPQVKPSQPILDTPRARVMRQKEEAVPPGVLPTKEIATPSAKRIQEEKKGGVSIPVSSTQKEEREESCFKRDKEVEKKAALLPKKFRILFCGQPRVISPKGLEFPLTVVTETGAEKSFLVSFNLLVNLEMIESEAN